MHLDWTGTLQQRMRWFARSSDAGSSERIIEQEGGPGLLMNSLNCIAADVKMGQNVRLAQFINLYGCEIGDETKIGTFVEIQKNAVVGKRCKISSHSFICEGVRIGDDVFVGHGVMFINDRDPRASVSGRPITDEWALEETIVGDGASIGSNATIMCGVRIGHGALVGAGSVVTANVAPNTVVAGNPAKPMAS